MTRLLIVAATAFIAVAQCTPLRARRDTVKQFKQIEDLPPFDSTDHHIWNHPWVSLKQKAALVGAWHKSFNAEHSSHGDIAIFGRFRAEGDPTQGADGGLTPVVPDVSHSNRQLAPVNVDDHLGTLTDRTVMHTTHVNQR